MWLPVSQPTCDVLRASSMPEPPAHRKPSEANRSARSACRRSARPGGLCCHSMNLADPTAGRCLNLQCNSPWADQKVSAAARLPPSVLPATESFGAAIFMRAERSGPRVLLSPNHLVDWMSCLPPAIQVIPQDARACAHVLLSKLPRTEGAAMTTRLTVCHCRLASFLLCV